MGIYPMAISRSEHDKFPWGRIKMLQVIPLVYKDPKELKAIVKES